MTPEAFIAKWQQASLKERSAAQEHFIDLCRMLGEPTPAEADPKGDWYAFEYGAKKAGGGDGWADVWKRGCFGWEYKGKGKDLQAAFKQLQLYAPALQYPPLLIVCDLDSIVIHTAFTNAVQETHVIPIVELGKPEQRAKLKWAFTEPERLRPGRTRSDVTAEAAGALANLAETLRQRGTENGSCVSSTSAIPGGRHDPHAVAHFLTQCLFCLYAEDAGLLPVKLFERIVEKSAKAPDRLGTRLGELFQTMRQGGEFLLEDIAWFNGGLFQHSDPVPLEASDIDLLLAAARMDWSAIDPAIFGTLFERGLDPAKRSQLGAHYTDPGTIRRLIDATIAQPLRAEWAAVKQQIEEQLAKADGAQAKSSATKARAAAEQHFHGHLERLRRFQVLDPACGSGNFLYLALQTLKDLEHETNLEAEALGLHRSFPQVGPENIKGIELNPYAAELARVTLWIGEIQWMLNHGQDLNRNPVLKPLETIEQRDALINPDGTESQWPAADVIIGNPPFLGGSKKRGELGDAYFDGLNRVYSDRVPGSADLVTYWFEKARAQIAAGMSQRAGLVATQSIRAGSNRQVLDRIGASSRIFSAWADEPWINEGAAVRVSLVCFGSGGDSQGLRLNGLPVQEIHSDLTGSGEEGGVNLTQAIVLPENAIAFEGTKKYGDFQIPGETAREWLALPNPNGRPNSDVVKPWRNGQDITGRASDTWIIDFGVDMPEAEAALYERPFQHLLTHVKPYRETVKRERTRRRWWIHEEARVSLRQALKGLPRYIVTPRVARHRFFVWLDVCVLPDTRLLVIARQDDTAFGILQSNAHLVWATAKASRHGVGNDPTYNAASCFGTFPFPEGLTPDLKPEEYTNPQAEAIAQAARRLNELRENWLNPPEWVERIPEVVPGYPDRLLPKPGHEADLRQRTLTNLNNQNPAWLQNAHRALDQAVAAAYDWPADSADDEILRRLLQLNLARSGAHKPPALSP
ncbi:MAG: DNA methyltransferase [Gammaproteobacteria bacterium RIFOXYD12_FULL_61_37]|nr:MAG: DNA methyltransferase [Gammaproteobacteria bacterium RIFOXYD12_FULL_61_37]